MLLKKENKGQLKLDKSMKSLLKDLDDFVRLYQTESQLVVDMLDENLPVDLNPLTNIESNITLEQAILLAKINQNPTKCGIMLNELFNTHIGDAGTSEIVLSIKNKSDRPDLDYIFQIDGLFHWSPILKRLSNYKKIWEYNNFHEARKQQMMDLYFKTYLLKSRITDAKDLHKFYGIAKKMENCTDEYLKQSKTCKDCSKCKYNPEFNIN